MDSTVEKFHKSTDSKPKNQGTGKLFENPFLEKLTRTHIAVPITIFFLYSASLLYWSIAHTSLSIMPTILLFSLGWLIFTWVEYNVHRYVFHMKTYTKFRAKIQYTLHGIHHDFPKDKDRLAMPPVLSITISTILLVLLRMILGDFTFAFLPGFLVGYASYLWVHYIVHAYNPPKNFLRMLWVNHAVHHYKDNNSTFGVSTPLWDYVYGTVEPGLKKKTAGSNL